MNTETKEQHTPGPWKVAGTSIVTDDNCIAVIEDDGGYEAPFDERKYNANLISAAPELMEALKVCLQFIPGATVRSWPPGHALREKAMNLGNEALKKARGN